MKFSALFAGVILTCGLALAQQPNPADPNQTNPTNPNRQTDPARTPPFAGPQRDSTTPERTTTTPRDTEGTADRQADKPADTKSDKPAELKTQTYKGTLVDASCAKGGSSSASSSETPAAAPAGTQTKAAGGAAATSGAADRAAAGGSCSVSASTSQFALKMTDGRTVQFDSVGNERAREAIKNKKKWTEAAGSGKEIKAKVSGAMSGEKLTVMSIN